MLSQNDLEIVCNKIFEQDLSLDYEELYQEIKECVDNNNFLLFQEEGQIKLFITWIEVSKNNKLHIYICNGFIDKSVNKKFNLCKLRRFFRQRYPEAYFFYWHSKKKNKFVYCK